MPAYPPKARPLEQGPELVSHHVSCGYVPSVFCENEVIENRKDVERFRKEKITGRDVFALSGWHPMGTCRMGVDPVDSVVQPSLETWDVPDLYIVDASVFPTALGVNPQLTIMAFSIRTTGFIDERLSMKGVKPRKKPDSKALEVPIALKETA